MGINTIVSYSEQLGEKKITITFDGRKNYTYSTAPTPGTYPITEKEYNDIVDLDKHRHGIGVRRYMHSNAIFSRDIRA